MNIWKRIVPLLIGLATLTGCSLKADGYEAVIDTAILEEHTKQVIAKSEAAEEFAKACKVAMIDPAVCGADTGCVMGVVMANMMASNNQADCVMGVGQSAAAVAIQVPEMRARGWASFNENFFGKFLNNNTGVIMGGILGIRSVEAMADVAVSAGRASIINDNSVVTTTGDTITSGDTVSDSGNTTSGDTSSQIVDNGSRADSPGDNNVDSNNDNSVDDNSDNAFAGCVVVPIVALPGSFTIRCDN